MMRLIEGFKTPDVPWYRRPALVDKTPLLAVMLLEVANIQQLIHMWTTWTSAGQSVGGWVCVHVALWLWLNFYLTFNRENKWAIWGTIVGIILNGAVILSVLFFRYWGA